MAASDRRGVPNGLPRPFLFEILGSRLINPSGSRSPISTRLPNGDVRIDGEFRRLRITAAHRRARQADDIERAITAFAQSPNGGLIVPSQGPMLRHRPNIIALAERHRLPAVYGDRVFAADGGLISFGADALDQYRRASGYFDRVLRGEKPADLPVQLPTRFELAINLKTAKALGLEVPWFLQ